MTSGMKSQYDPEALKERARQWLDEAQRATSQAIREVCLAEAEKYTRRLRQSLSTPVFRETSSVES
jgi:hypothetical protein